jgi:hypothetical protein
MDICVVNDCVFITVTVNIPAEFSSAINQSMRHAMLDYFNMTVVDLVF